MLDKAEYIMNILLLLGLVIVAYSLFLIYKEQANLREEFQKLKIDLEGNLEEKDEFEEELDIPKSKPIDIPGSSRLFYIGPQSESDLDMQEIEDEPDQSSEESEIVHEDGKILNQPCEETDQNESTHEDEEIVLHSEKPCEFIMKSGKRKGQDCGLTSCKRHS